MSAPGPWHPPRLRRLLRGPARHLPTRLLFGQPWRVRQAPAGPHAGPWHTRALDWVAPDGLVLRAWLRQPADGPARYLVVHCGGRNEDVAWSPTLLSWLPPGGALVALQYRGTGASAGTVSEAAAVADLDALLTALRQDPALLLPVAPLVWCGRSLGSAIALQVARRHPPAALVLQAPLASLGSRLGLPAGSRWHRHLDGRGAAAALPPCPALVLLSGRDRVVPHAESRRLVAALRGPVQCVVLPGTGHGSAMRDAQALARIGAFFHGWLDGPSGTVSGSPDNPSRPRRMYPSFTLPVDDHLVMDAKEARQAGSLLHEDFNNAAPFPNIVLEDFLPEAVLKRAMDGFPSQRLASDGVFEAGYAGQFKRQILPEECSPATRELFWFFNSQAMLRYLEGLTGIEGLLPDPDFMGGGYHETTRGGLLGVHADFRIHEKLRLQRRLNLIVYLNPEWDDAWKGQLELWSRDMKQCVATISPVLNRCVVFRTDADTWHGHPDALQTPDGVARRSMALYYYTASPSIFDEVPNNSTVYVPRAGDAPEVQREARRLLAWERIRDWVPPAMYRGLTKLRWRLAARSKR